MPKVQEWMFISKQNQIELIKHEISQVQTVCNRIKVKANVKPFFPANRTFQQHTEQLERFDSRKHCSV